MSLSQTPINKKDRMADVKGGFTKAVQKHAGRAKEKVMSCTVSSYFNK